MNFERAKEQFQQRLESIQNWSHDLLNYLPRGGARFTVAAALAVACGKPEAPVIPIAVSPVPVDINLQHCVSWNGQYKEQVDARDLLRRNHEPEVRPFSDIKCSMRDSELIKPCPRVKEEDKKLYTLQSCGTPEPYRPPR